MSANHLYSLLVNFDKLGINRSEVFEKFKLKGIGVHVHYIPIPMQPYYRERFGFDPLKIKNAMNYYHQALTLPIFPDMTDDQIEFVVESVFDIVG